MPWTLKDKQRFPAFKDLPGDRGERDAHYFKPGDRSKPNYHWCLLSEVVQSTGWPLRPTYSAKDVNGSQITIAFYVPAAEFPYVLKRCSPGHTMAFKYAKKHFFAGGQTGIRVESMDLFKVFPLGIKELVALGDTLKHARACAACRQYARHKCGRCDMPYCSRDCQVKDWPSVHKRVCRTAMELTKWSKQDWGTFEGYKGFW